MAALEELANEALGYVRDLPYLAAQNMVHDAWRKVRDARHWSFLRGEAAIDVPALISSGTVTTTQFSASVVGDATAAAAWLAITQPVITLRQFRLGAGSPIYNIIAFDGVNTLTLDRNYSETGAASLAYEVYQCYYKAPVKDFLLWKSIYNPQLAYRFRRRNLYRKKEEVDRRDPQRSYTGLPIWAAAYKAASDGYPLYEFWPHSTAATTLITEFQRTGTDLTSTEDLPPAIPKDLVSMRLRTGIYEWKAAQVAAAGQNNAGFLGLIRAADSDYQDLLKRATRNDEETFPQNFSELEEDIGLSGPIDAAYLQSHDIWNCG